ncbi:hypothetical protein CKO51_04025 [Rhodopirellula sp. SM50]|nr:hypothetical protein CKO51_04025 [Rhodopirellula sp. SM50]
MGRVPTKTGIIGQNRSRNRPSADSKPVKIERFRTEIGPSGGRYWSNRRLPGGKNACGSTNALSIETDQT